ncbi:MAG: hypothetical protein KBE04_06885 [Phycisphaerae bacterium]|nr:hypothetical protein [Phycisphaerae bacterium]
MKTRSVLFVLAALLVVGGCGDRKLYEEALARAQKAEQQIAQVTQELDQVKSEKATLDTSVQKLTGDLEAANKTVDELRSAADKAKATLQTAIREKDALQAQFKEISATVTSLKSQVAEKDTKIAQLDQAIKVLKETLDKVKAGATGLGAAAPSN